MESCATTAAAAPDTDEARARLIDEALTEGLCRHRAGDLAAAAELYGCILAVDPEHAQALHLSGVIAHQQGTHDVALALVRRALRQVPRYAAAHYTLGAVLLAVGDFESARSSLDGALALSPCHVPAMLGLAAALRSLGRYDEACQRCDLANARPTSPAVATRAAVLPSSLANLVASHARPGRCRTARLAGRPKSGWMTRFLRACRA